MGKGMKNQETNQETNQEKKPRINKNGKERKVNERNPHDLLVITCKRILADSAASNLDKGDAQRWLELHEKCEYANKARASRSIIIKGMVNASDRAEFSKLAEVTE